jgi:hypothetical protein
MSKMIPSSTSLARATIAAILATCSTPALAQADAGFGGGLSIPKDTRLETKTNTLRVKTVDGWNGSAFVGYRLNRVRFELEARRAQMSVVRISDAKGRDLDLTSPSDPRREDSLFANLYYAQPLNRDRTVSAFVGGGLGVSRLTMRAKNGVNCREVLAVRIVHTEQTGRTGPSGTCTDQGKSGDVVLSWQALAGLGLRLTPTSPIEFRPTFRYVRHENVETAGNSAPTREYRARDKLDYSSYQASIAALWSF